ncbi:hypothetical protein MSAN_01122000 [Mycena sanguinolenta]|uniref:Uncharacterized protein n=1 Tax=Mycena sanguinolenta TaxID=230812 RepID=A0A8H6YMG1_9AGAR|nr:hypothetical protein MSAN_01122000 [Mycena sanguinolenta]
MQSTVITFSTHQQKNITKPLESAISSLFHIPDLKPTDVHVLSVTVLTMVVFHAVHTSVLTSASHTTQKWIPAVTSFIEDNKLPLQEKANTIAPQVAAIVGRMKKRSLIPLLNLSWDFSEKEATTFATELSQCIEANLM